MPRAQREILKGKGKGIGAWPRILTIVPRAEGVARGVEYQARSWD